MINSEQARELLQRGVKDKLVLPPQRAEQSYAVPYFAFRPQILPPGFNHLSVGTGEGRRAMIMEAHASAKLKDQVLLCGWERKGRSGAALMLIEEKLVIAQDARGSDGIIYKGRARLGTIGTSELDIYFPAGPLPEEVLTEPLVLQLLASTVRGNSLSNLGVNWMAYAALPQTSDAVREAIQRPYLPR